MRPLYEHGSQVRVVRAVHDDGTFPGRSRGDLLIRRGSLGFVRDIGVMLQDQIIYQIYFVEAGITVGCREQELIGGDEPWVESRFEFGEPVISGKTLMSKGQVLVEAGSEGRVMAVRRELTPLSYEVLFHDRLLLVPESALLDPLEGVA